MSDTEALAVLVKLIQARQAHRGRASTTQKQARRDTEIICAVLRAGWHIVNGGKVSRSGSPHDDLVTCQAFEDTVPR